LILYFSPVKGADSLSAYGIIQKYISVIGGKEKLAAELDRVTQMEGNVQKVKIVMTVYQKQPDKFKQIIHIGEVEQTILFANDKGYIKINDKVSEIKGGELAKLKNEATLNLLLNLDTNIIHLNYLGIDTIDGKPAYKILLKNSSINWIHYYDVASGFKVMDEKPIVAPQGTFMQESRYYDFRPVNGIYFPFIIKQKLGSQQNEFNVTGIKINSGIDDSEFTIEE
jgi:hypothetical protein